MLFPSLLTMLELAITAYSCPVGLSVGGWGCVGCVCVCVWGCGGGWGGGVKEQCCPWCYLSVDQILRPKSLTSIFRWIHTPYVFVPQVAVDLSLSKNCMPTMQRKFPRICAVLLESYSIAGLHRHHNENKNYAIVSSDEGQFLLTSIRNKEGRNERECALVNKLWDGQGDKTTMKDSDSGFQSTSFSMIIFIQP